MLREREIKEAEELKRRDLALQERIESTFTQLREAEIAEQIKAAEQAARLLEAARHAKRLRTPGWRGDRGQGRWPVQRLLERE